MKNKSFLLPAGALYFTLQLSVFILLILSAFVGWVYLNRQIRNQAEKKISAQQQARSLIRETARNTTDLLTLENEVLTASPFGLFEVVQTKAGQVPTVALLGMRERNAETILYLPNQGQNLYIGKEVDLIGAIQTAPAGLRTTHLGNNNKQNQTANLDFQLQQSQKQLPPLSAQLTGRIERLLDPQQWEQSAFSFNQQSFTNSFFAPLHIVEIDRPTRLENIELAGHIWLRATAPITVAASAKINDILLTAPKIYFEAGFKGRVQAMASEALQVRENCQFQYPSVLWLAQKKPLENSGTPPFSIGHKSNVGGLIGYTQKGHYNGSGVALSIAPETSIYGRVYCSGILSTAATVVGSVYAQELGVLHQGVLYKHHLLYGGLLKDVHHTTSAGLSFAAPNTKKVLQWLY